MSRANGNQPTVGLVREMEVAYLDYAMSVLVSRALPDVRDGLKPVHRRILYAMYHDLHLHSAAAYKKSARIVGEVLGKYHPHSDQAVYDAMIRLAQDFSLRYPLVDGQGNLGSIDGDNPAAMRYTEARLAPIANLILEDIARQTVDWRANFDDTLQEPVILPTALPNLLVNGANGIAVGMATQIPPHNLGEICDALCFLLDNFDEHQAIDTATLLDYVKGPDFPTGGILYRFAEPTQGRGAQEDRLLGSYASGRGRFILQAKMHTEAMGMGRTRIVVTQIPYLTNKIHLIERIVHYVRRGNLAGIADVRDESDRAGMRICIELSRTAHLPQVLDRLFALTPLQQTFSLSLVALVNGRPQRLNLKDMLIHFIDHRLVAVRRRSEFELQQAQARVHIVEGLLQALDMLDDIIRVIRKSRRVATARANLSSNFDFSPAQAQAVLAMPLQQLIAMEIRQVRNEFRDLTRQIRTLEQLLASEERMRALIKGELQQIRQDFGDQRRTRIVEQAVQALSADELEPDHTVWVAVGTGGTVKRYPYRGMQGGRFREIGRHGSLAAVTANTRDMLHLFSADGKCQQVQVFQLPQTGAPQHAANLTAFTRRALIVAAIPLPRASRQDCQWHVCMVTRQGMVKRVHINRLIEASGEEQAVIALKKGDSLGWVLLSDADQDLMLFTVRGKAIRFQAEDVRSMGLGSAGVRAMAVDKTDALAAAALVQSTSTILSVTRNGFVKRTSIDAFTRQKRGGKGLISHKLTAMTGAVAGVVAAGRQHEAAKLAVRAGRHTVLLDVPDIPETGRLGQGRHMRQLNGESRVESVTLLWSEARVDEIPAPPTIADMHTPA